VPGLGVLWWCNANCYVGDRLTLTYGVTLEITTQNASILGSEGYVDAAAVAFPVVQVPPLPCPCIPPNDTPVLQRNVDASDDLLTNPIKVDSTASKLRAWCHAHASASSTIGTSLVESSIFNGDLIFFRQRGSDHTVCERVNGYESDLAPGLADFKIYNDYARINPSLPLSVIPEIRVRMRLFNECWMNLDQCAHYAIPCNPSINLPVFACSTPDPSLILPLMAFMNIKIVMIVSGVPTTAYLQGVMGADPTGNPFRLGFFTDSTFAQDAFANVDVATYTVPLPSLPTDISRIEVYVDSDHFQSFDGDLDNDGNVCWTDRRLALACVGSSIGSAAYNARADFDLDGDVDQTDFAAFHVVFSSSACTADFDCSGSFGSQDYFDFQNAYFQSDPIADFNADGSVTSQDWLDFLNAFFNGC
jgi:hypothetical protein